MEARRRQPRPLHLAALAGLLTGCAVDVGARTALYRDTPVAAHPGRSRERPVSFPVGARAIPRRGHGGTLGGEVEVAACGNEAGCSPHAEVRNVSLLAGYSRLPPADRRPHPGVDVLAFMGLGRPAGDLRPEDCRPAPCSAGMRYRLGAALDLAQPVRTFDATHGFVVAGFMLDLVGDVRAGIWSPAPGDRSGRILVETTLGLSLRLRVLTDLLSAHGYPGPQRSP